MAMAAWELWGEGLQERIIELEAARCELDEIAARLGGRDDIPRAEKLDALSSDLTQLFAILRRVGFNVPNLHHG